MERRWKEAVAKTSKTSCIDRTENPAAKRFRATEATDGEASWRLHTREVAGSIPAAPIVVIITITGSDPYGRFVFRQTLTE